LREKKVRGSIIVNVMCRYPFFSEEIYKERRLGPGRWTEGKQL